LTAYDRGVLAQIDVQMRRCTSRSDAPRSVSPTGQRFAFANALIESGVNKSDRDDRR
jgi:hypothetical protein